MYPHLGLEKRNERIEPMEQKRPEEIHELNQWKRKGQK